MNQFLVVAAAEKIAAMQTEEFFSQRRNRADREAFRRSSIARAEKLHPRTRGTILFPYKSSSSSSNRTGEIDQVSFKGGSV